MLEKEFIEKLQGIVEESQIFEKEELSRHITFRVGGPADVLVSARISQVQAIQRLCQQENIPMTVIGNGSNLLVGDRGIRGLVLEFGKEARECRIEGTMMCVSAGTLLSKAAHEAAAQGLGGLEFAAGIPGTIGGAIVMNAGAYGGEIVDVLREATVLTAEGEIRIVKKEELDLSYRHSNVLENGYIILGAVLDLHPDNKEEILARMEDYKTQRVAKQPLNYPSAGSTFKRPKDHIAAKLIQDAGLKGYQVGGAQVSEKHSGFVINKEHATASDICTLMQDVARIVEEKYGVALEPEVKMLGEF